jgi:hypothetical protein
MKDEMYADPSGIVEKGENIKRLARLCLEEINAVSSESERIKTAWDDSVSNVFVQQIKEYVPKFEKLQQGIEEKLGDTLVRHGYRLMEDQESLVSQAEDL